MHQLINRKSTGDPGQFAQKLGISKSNLYLIIKELKFLGAPIVFSKPRNSFIYLHPVDFKFGFMHKSISEDHMRRTYGGMRLGYCAFIQDRRWMLPHPAIHPNQSSDFYKMT